MSSTSSFSKNQNNELKDAKTLNWSVSVLQLKPSYNTL